MEYMILNDQSLIDLMQIANKILQRNHAQRKTLESTVDKDETDRRNLRAHRIRIRQVIRN